MEELGRGAYGKVHKGVMTDLVGVEVFLNPKRREWKSVKAGLLLLKHHQVRITRVICPVRNRTSRLSIEVRFGQPGLLSKRNSPAHYIL